MNAARRRISGDGELEKGWKRLFGISNSGFDPNAPEAGGCCGAFFTACACPSEDTDRIPAIFSDSCNLDWAFPGSFVPFCCPVDMDLCPSGSRGDSKVRCVLRGAFFRVLRHLWQVYEAEERMVI
jgi:hypothetical protein